MARENEQRHDRANARANEMDARSDQMDVRSGRVDRRLDEVLVALEDAVKAVQAVEIRVKASQACLEEERQRDRIFARWVAVVALMALLGGVLGSIAAYSTCRVANTNRETIRIIIAAAYSRNSSTATTTPDPAAQHRREEFQKVVDSRTRRLNCANPLRYLEHDR